MPAPLKPTLTRTWDIDASAAVGLWAVLQSVACIVCCCAPVYKPLLPARGVWGYLSSKLRHFSSNRLSTWSLFTRSSRRRGSDSKPSDSQGFTIGNLTLDEYQQQGEAWAAQTDSSANCLVASDSSGQIYPLDSIQVHKSVEVNFETPSSKDSGGFPSTGSNTSPAVYAEAEGHAPHPTNLPAWNGQWQPQPYMPPTGTGQQSGPFVQCVPMWDGRQYVPAVPVWNGQQYHMQPAWDGYQPHVQGKMYAAQPQPMSAEEAEISRH